MAKGALPKLDLLRLFGNYSISQPAKDALKAAAATTKCDVNF